VNGPKAKDSVYCAICGLLLHLENVQIDHSRPQTGGECEAVLKVLRALGMTAEGPQGHKGQLVQDYLLNDVKIPGAVTHKKNWVNTGKKLADRYTLTEVGDVLITMVL